jgi:hypothetical protein
MRKALFHRLRRGVTTTQIALVLVFVVILVMATMATLGTSTRQSLNATATNAGNPNSLVTRFSSGSGS